MVGITDLLDKYDQSGNKDPTQTNGNSIISQQINYINALRTYINTVNDAVNNNCNDGEYTNLDEFKSKCTKNGLGSSGGNCTVLCDNLNTQGNAITSGSESSIYITFGTDFEVPQSHANEYDNVIANSEKIRQLRNELDLKLKDLSKTPDSRFQEYEDNYNYELMMNITWSILATSIIYFVFIKL
jgi:hypothetical protein